LIDKVKIGGIVYDVVLEETLGDSGYAGQLRVHRSQIAINAQIQAQFAQVTLWHEIIHGILANAGVGIADHNEELIEKIAYGVLQVLVDNPALTDGTLEKEGDS